MTKLSEGCLAVVCGCALGCEPSVEIDESEHGFGTTLEFGSRAELLEWLARESEQLPDSEMRVSRSANGEIVGVQARVVTHCGPS